jgi:hypothetical protein
MNLAKLVGRGFGVLKLKLRATGPQIQQKPSVFVKKSGSRVAVRGIQENKTRKLQSLLKNNRYLISLTMTAG